MVFKSFYIRFRSFFLYHLMLFVNYILFLSAVSNHLMSTKSVFLVLLSYILIGIGGYLFNDYHDKKLDLQAGKTSTMNYFSPLSLKVVLFICWFTGFILISYLSYPAGFLILLQIALLIMYSHPLFRLKERGGLGVIVDSLYAYVIPVIIILIIGGYTIDKRSLILFLVFNLFVGIRDILLHQKFDLVADRKNGSFTFFVKNEKAALLFINLADLAALVSLFLFFLISLEWRIIVLVSFFILLVKMLSSFRRHIEFNSLIQFYVIVSTFHIAYWLLVTEHYIWLIFLLHPYNIGFIKTGLSLLRKVISVMVNFPLYYIALLFGRNLKNDPFKW